MTCPICAKRKPKRFCPARGESICAICCGTERERTIECLPDCPHLLAARRYEIEHRQPLGADEIPFPDLEINVSLIREHPELLSGLGITILRFAHENPSLHDPEILAALSALAETSRTLESGIYFERPPDSPLPRALYSRLAEFLQEFQKQGRERSGFRKAKNAEVLRLLVFLLRVGRRETNGRPRSKAFLDFLYSRFPAEEPSEAKAPRIILP